MTAVLELWIKRDNVLFTTSDYFGAQQNHVMLVLYYLQHERGKIHNAPAGLGQVLSGFHTSKHNTACKQRIVPLS